jgi:hypothetical protein
MFIRTYSITLTQALIAVAVLKFVYTTNREQYRMLKNN